MTSPRVRADLASLDGYHSPQVVAEVRLNTNESPFAPSTAFLDDFASWVVTTSLNRYPDRSMVEIRGALASTHGVALDEIFCANGSNEVIQSLLLAFGGAGRTCLVFEPTYALHSHIARITATAVTTCEREPDFTLHPEKVAEAVLHSTPAITFLCSPNNPTGITESLEVVTAALEASRSFGGIVVVDEAYGQFAEHTASSLRSGTDGDRLVIMRTFSKTWALAGLRLGYLEASTPIVEGCMLVGLPYSVSTLTQKAGCLALKYAGDMDRQVQQLKQQRRWLLGALGDLEVTTWPSQANFILFRPRSTPGHEVWTSLLERSVLVRDFSSWPRLSECLRVTVGTMDENGRFIEALKEAL